jgi:hypothetical protein
VALLSQSAFADAESVAATHPPLLCTAEKGRYSEGPSDTETFSLYMRNVLAPRLEAGQIVLMDNLSVHKSG